MSTTQQPEALIFANDRPSAIDDDLYQWAIDAEDLIRHQHARIADLEALLSAIGAGGVEPLRKSAAPVSPVCFALYDSQGFYETRDTEQQCIDFCKHYNARDARLGGGLAPYTHGALYAAPQPPAQEVHPESIREGVPYGNPAFEQLARDMGVWGTTQSAVCAQFWLAATQPAAQRSAYAAKGVKEVFCKKCEMTVISNCGSASGCPVRNIYAAQAKHGEAQQ